MFFNNNIDISFSQVQTQIFRTTTSRNHLILNKISGEAALSRVVLTQGVQRSQFSSERWSMCQSHIAFLFNQGNKTSLWQLRRLQQLYNNY